jgi:putative flippase GtrA
LSPFARFLITGGIAAGVNVLSRLALSLAMPFEAAIVVAYVIGMTTAWALARLFVFEPTGRGATGEYLRFGLVNVVALAQVWLVSVGLSRLVFPEIGFDWNAELVAHLIGVASPVATSYYGHKLFTFRRSGE